MEVFLTFLAIILGWTAFYLIYQRRNQNRPPCISGWIPWIGVGFKFGKEAMKFIEQVKIKHGPIFTIYALGNRLTFVMEEQGIDAFFKSKDINFEQAVQDPVYRTVSIPKNIFFKYHGILYGLMKNKMKNTHLNDFKEQMVEGLHEQLESLGTNGNKNLFNLIRDILYPVTVNAIFGKGLYPTTQEKIEEFLHHFQNYDEHFQFASQIPECFLRDWSESKKWFLTLFEKVIPNIQRGKSSHDSLTLLQIITSTVREGKDGSQASRYALLMLWASISNTIPVAFWAAAFILNHPTIYKNIMEDITSVFGEAGKKKIDISENDLKKIPLIKWCVLETIRLVSPGIITRKVVAPLKVLNYTIPSGDLLMLSPFWVHRNPKYYPEPELFKPERWEKANLEKNAFLDYFVAFGGGKYPCPGRWFALLEIEICLVILFYKYHFSLLDPFPELSANHVVGVQKPLTPCRVEYKCRR